MYTLILRNLKAFGTCSLCKSKLSHAVFRGYHSEKGYFGYRTFKKTEYKVAEDILHIRNDLSNVYRWIQAYRKHGHRLASIDPVKFRKNSKNIQELQYSHYGLNPNRKIAAYGLVNIDECNITIAELENRLRSLYCGFISAEFEYIESEEEKEWFAENLEKIQKYTLTENARKNIAQLLIKSQAWDNFLATKFPSVKRYGGEGAENMLTFFQKIFELAVEDNLEHIVLAMPHRGRLSLLTMLNVRPAKIFRKFRGLSEFPDGMNSAMGDVSSHYNASESIAINGKIVRISMLRNPSHLESVNPVSMGKTRSKQMTAHDGAFSCCDSAEKRFSTFILNIQLHGDAAFAGQGVNQECLMMAYVPNFEIGGTIHMIVNNQLGFTTPADRGRSTRYASDLAKSIEAPVIHVNGDDVEAVSQATKLAFDYQRKFRKDVFIDLNCFRRWGHNELDDPTVTNPAIYSIINHRKSVPDLYAEQLVIEGCLTQEEVLEIRKKHIEYLNTELKSSESYNPEPTYFQRQWHGLQQAPNCISYWDTGVNYSLLQYIGATSVAYPKDFNIHPHLLKTHVNGRLKKLQDGVKLDWATAEALAVGSLMYQGHTVRLSGEDVGRGTFSHRHAMLVDQKTNEMFLPLNQLAGGLGGKLEIAQSILSEEAVLGFEYGMAIDNPNNLIMWEAQFGDFFNGAQIIIDNFIVSGETKWMESNGLVILLPHGYDGTASEHSSCRIERFLQLTDSKETSPDGDDVNLHVINPTNPAQYFHALRRQIIRNFRKPLVVVAPKTLLRLAECSSTHEDFAEGQQFRNVIGDVKSDPKKVTKVILCSGKHYYNLDAERAKGGYNNVAIIRLESLCPFPVYEIQQELSNYKGAINFVWSQEEARNMGAWTFVRSRFEHMIGKPLKYCGRVEGATTAVGDGNVHRKEAEDVVTTPFKI